MFIRIEYLLVSVWVLLSGCFSFLPDSRCYDNYFDLQEDIGRYEILPIPDLEVQVGDTLWFEKDEYFKSYNDCDLGYGSFNFDVIEMDYEIANFFTSERYVGIIGKEIGETNVFLLGNAYLRRDDVASRIPDSVSFKINVIENKTGRTGKRPDEALPPFFKITDVSFEKDVRGDDLYLGVIFKFSNGHFENEYYTVYNYWSEGNDHNFQSNNSLGSSETNGADFRWDSAATDMYLKLRRLNWISDEEGYREDVSSQVQMYMHLKSYPLNVHPTEREFERIGY